MNSEQQIKSELNTASKWYESIYVSPIAQITSLKNRLSQTLNDAQELLANQKRDIEQLEKIIETAGASDSVFTAPLIDFIDLKEQVELSAYGLFDNTRFAEPIDDFIEFRVDAEPFVSWLRHWEKRFEKDIQYVRNRHGIVQWVSTLIPLDEFRQLACHFPSLPVTQTILEETNSWQGHGSCNQVDILASIIPSTPGHSRKLSRPTSRVSA